MTNKPSGGEPTIRQDSSATHATAAWTYGAVSASPARRAGSRSILVPGLPVVGCELRFGAWTSLSPVSMTGLLL